MSVLVEGSESSAEEGALRDLIIEDGEGRLYYRLGLRYAPQTSTSTRSTWLHGAAHHAAVDDPDDVAR